MGGALGGMMRMVKREVSDDDRIKAASLKEVRGLVAFATSLEYSVFQLEDARTPKDLRSYLESQELEFPEMVDIIPIPIIISLLHPRHSVDVSTKEVVDLIIQYTTLATMAVRSLKTTQCMDSLLKLRDVIMRITHSGTRFCEIVAVLNGFSGYLQNHPDASDSHAQFIHRALLTATAAYRKMR